MKVNASARVRLTIDIPLTDSWGGDCPLEQVEKQAKDVALGMIRNSQFHELKMARIVGEPEVTAILTSKER